MQLDDDMKDAVRIKLFERYKKLGNNVRDLNSIIQNDVPLTKSDLEKWESQIQIMAFELKETLNKTKEFMKEYMIK